ncbi:MAG: helix-turn-helix transcriptional regulator [Sphingobacteriales bacterium]|nr:helix-turn-helix transcriptional regulator [Sphingobacteriales bacterium]OJW00147.1 MAG: AraC family transcriptional regulator [Sphingobacteriales bacterium 44-61]
MKKSFTAPYMIRSISEWHQLFDLPKPLHPLISVVDVSLLNHRNAEVWKHYAQDFYSIALKVGHNCKLIYGQKDYDFNEGSMQFNEPGQVFKILETNNNPVSGSVLLFKSDLVRNYPLGKIIREYGFFSYALSEALHLSDSEKAIVLSLMQQIQNELKCNIDNFSQDIIVSHIELLLNYANRFYNRQFITRKTDNNNLLSKLDELLTFLLNDDQLSITGIPTVQAIAQELNVSPNYLSDMLRMLTGLTTQQHIHGKLIERAKVLLTTTPLSVSEIAYRLGFEYPQSFNKLFKNKTSVSPSAFRHSFN